LNRPGYGMFILISRGNDFGIRIFDFGFFV
jgi:hypothetical protein